jgi:hydrogenase nickel incorporation protein HypB
VNTRIVEIRKGILKKNDLLAAELRGRFHQAGLFAVNLVSSPGTGKTTFLQRTLKSLLQDGFHAATLVGDLETDNDARRLAESGAPVRQINTHGICHLEAEMVGQHLDGWNLSAFDFFFIENVGNLVCPSNVAVITKMDLATACDFDLALTRRNLREIRPDIRIFEVSAKTGQGMAEWLTFLHAARQETLQERSGSPGPGTE